MSQKYHNGAFVFYRVSAQCGPMTPAEIERLAAQHSLPSSIATGTCRPSACRQADVTLSQRWHSSTR